MTYPWNGAAKLADATDFVRAAEAIGCDVAAIRAVWEVEAACNPFRADGSLERRFELHKTTPPLMPYSQGLKLTNAARERLFMKRYAENPEDAMRATSFGAPQIMGFNHLKAGYPSAAQMVASFAQSEGNQIGAFVRLAQAWGIDSALRAHDWKTFARVYNGNANVASYSAKIEAAYRRLSGAASPQVLKSGDKGAAVKRLQEALGATVDGSFGPDTEHALREFQRDNGLVVDGKAGQKTWEALARQVDVKPPAQPTQSDLIATVTAQAGAGAAALGTVSAALRELPETATTLLVGGAVLAGLLALAAWLYRRARA
ncbi:N-acetylmuramidase domain-containing protein [Paenirhodobacter populi]|uniref:N-acetylmuramidase domain-containing protein n=1 Tax=Paenirhodobacter populi TaxID=2306993 RepID=UPI000FE365B1|nr:N-acetylmuramidase domain-containing protein [Sinirhodobacter populi]RWR09818.1 DUF3380 domain-containing protein [Sinirhodobacter populi]